jgi:hypothetical protein
MAAMNARPQSALNMKTWLLVALGWLVPGAGYFLLPKRQWNRGIIFLVSVHLTFLLGIILKGGLVPLPWSASDPSFSIVNNLTFILQMGAGWPALLSLGAYYWNWGALAAEETHAWYELGSFYCLVAGSLNYFVVCHSVDRNRKKAFEMIENA